MWYHWFQKYIGPKLFEEWWNFQGISDYTMYVSDNEQGSSGLIGSVTRSHRSFLNMSMAYERKHFRHGLDAMRYVDVIRGVSGNSG
jgi:hypothetical protein